MIRFASEDFLVKPKHPGGHSVGNFGGKPMAAIRKAFDPFGAKAIGIVTLDVRIMLGPKDDGVLVCKYLLQLLLPACEVPGICSSVPAQHLFFHRWRDQVVGTIDLVARELARCTPELAREAAAAGERLDNFTDDRRPPESTEQVPTVVRVENRVHHDDAFYLFGVLHDPRETERATDIVNDQIQWFGNAKRGDETVHKSCHPVERIVKIYGRGGQAEAG